MARQSPAAQRRALEILLIEDDPVDASWLRELILEKAPTSQVVQAASVQDALPILAQRPVDAVFFSVHPDGGALSIQGCRDLLRAVGARPVVVLVNAANMVYAADVRAAGVRFIYRKHPIWRIAHIRKQGLRDKWNALLAGREQAHDAPL